MYVSQNGGGARSPTDAPPAIVSGKIVTPSLDVARAPARPSVHLKYTSAGYLEDVEFEFVSPSGYQHYYLDYYAPIPASKAGSATFESSDASLGPYAQAGAWILDAATLYDFDEQYTEYSETQLASLFPSLTLNVINKRASDSEPPTVSSGIILTPKVHLSAPIPAFKAQMTVADNLSGVANSYNATLVLVSPGNQVEFLTQSSATAPVLSGTITTAIDFKYYSPVPTGIWTISEYQLCDVAGNCLSDNSSSDIQALFGTNTFKVVQ